MLAYRTFLCQIVGVLSIQPTEISLDAKLTEEVCLLQGARGSTRQIVDLDALSLVDCGGTYEAEQAEISHAQISHRHSGFSGDGFVELRRNRMDSIEWSVLNCQGGSHTLHFRYALKRGNRPQQVIVNGVTQADELSFPSTGSWRNWHETSLEVNLDVGPNVITLRTAGSRGVNVDSLRISAFIAQPQYVLLIDAGSTGSRLRIFTRTVDGRSLQQIVVADEDEDLFRAEPGLSAYASNVEGAGPPLVGMLQAAQLYVPEEHQARANLYLQATAGMRLLPRSQSHAILEAVRNYLEQPSQVPFLFRAAEIISGEREALFAYMGINSHLGRVGTDNEVGILDLGGASTQVAFKTSQDIRANEFHYYWEGARNDLYTSSYMRFGADAAVLRSKQALVAESADGALEVTHPCFHTGFSEETELQGRVVTFIGSSNPSECSQLMLGLLHTEYECMMEPCAIMGNHMAAHDNDFYAISAYFYTANGLGLLGWNDVAVLEPGQIQERTSQFCALSWDDAQAATFSPPRYSKNYCALGNYISHLLTAYGFPSASRKITFSRKIDGRDADWTVGAALYEVDAMPLSLEGSSHCSGR